MKKMTNKAANVFHNHSSLKKGIDYLFLCRVHLNYIFHLLGALKIGVIVGPLFEAFMEGAVYERLIDSEAKAIVTTPELLDRVPVDKLPHLETIFLVGEDIEEDGKIIDFNKAFKRCFTNFEIEWWIKKMEHFFIIHQVYRETERNCTCTRCNGSTTSNDTLGT